jgi:hypothetical protein
MSSDNEGRFGHPAVTEQPEPGGPGLRPSAFRFDEALPDLDVKVSHGLEKMGCLSAGLGACGGIAAIMVLEGFLWDGGPSIEGGVLACFPGVIAGSLAGLVAGRFCRRSTALVAAFIGGAVGAAVTIGYLMLLLKATANC